MRKMQLMLLFWIIATYVNAANLTPQENEERARKCGLNELRTLVNPNNKTIGVFLSQRHFITNPQHFATLATNCSSNLVVREDDNPVRKATFIGNCDGLQGFVIVESFAVVSDYACLPSEKLKNDDRVLGYSKDFEIDLQVKGCSDNRDQLCFDKAVSGFGVIGGIIVSKSNNNVSTVQGYGHTNSGDEAVAIPIYDYLDDICANSGICPVSTTTTEPSTSTVATTTTAEETTTEATTTEAATTIASPVGTAPLITSPDPVITTIAITTRTAAQSASGSGAVQTTSSSPTVTKSSVDTEAEKELKEILKKCEDEYLCWDEDIFSSASSCTLLIALIGMAIALFD